MTAKTLNGIPSERNGTKISFWRNKFWRRREKETKRVLKDHAPKEKIESKRKVTWVGAKVERRRARSDGGRI